MGAAALLLLSLANIYLISKRLGTLRGYWDARQYSESPSLAKI